jgi:hypothetical protein
VPILTAELQRLCAIAADQAASTPDLELLLGGATVAATMARALTAVTVDAVHYQPHSTRFRRGRT